MEAGGESTGGTAKVYGYKASTEPREAAPIKHFFWRGGQTLRVPSQVGDLSQLLVLTVVGVVLVRHQEI